MKETRRQLPFDTEPSPARSPRDTPAADMATRFEEKIVSKPKAEEYLRVYSPRSVSGRAYNAVPFGKFKVLPPIDHPRVYRDEINDSPRMSRGVSARFFTPPPYIKSPAHISHVSWHEPEKHSFVGDSFQHFAFVKSPVVNEPQNDYEHRRGREEIEKLHLASEMQAVGTLVDRDTDTLEKIIPDDMVKTPVDLEELIELEKLQTEYEAWQHKLTALNDEIERRQLDIEEQDRILDDIMQIARTEHEEMEKVHKAYADAMKAYNDFKEEAINRRVFFKEVQIETEIVYEENDDLRKELTDKVFLMNEIKERRHIGASGFKTETVEMQTVAEKMKEENDKLEAEIKAKVEEFNSLRMALSDKGIHYVSKRKAEKVDKKVDEKFVPLSENPLKIDLDLGEIHDTGMILDTKIVDVGTRVMDTPRFVKEQKKMTKASRPDLNEANALIEKVDVSVNKVGCGAAEVAEKEEKVDIDIEDLENKALDMKRRICALSAELDKLLGSSFENEEDKGQNNSWLQAFNNSFDEEDKIALDEYESDKRDDKKYERGIKDGEAGFQLRRQLSAIELARLPGKRDKKTRIPQPVVRLFNCAVRDGDRFVVSKTNSSVLVTRDDYDRNKLLPFNNRGVHSKDKSKVLKQVEKRTCIQHKVIKRPKKLEVKSKINTGLNDMNKNHIKPVSRQRRTERRVTDKENKLVKKNEYTKPKPVVPVEPFKPKRRDIRPRIDTGLQTLRKKQAADTHEMMKLDKRPSIKEKPGRTHNDNKRKPSIENKRPTPTRPSEYQRASNKLGFTNKKIAGKVSLNSKAALPAIKPKSNSASSLNIKGEIRQYVAPLPPIKKPESSESELGSTFTPADYYATKTSLRIESSTSFSAQVRTSIPASDSSGFVDMCDHYRGLPYEHLPSPIGSCMSPPAGMLCHTPEDSFGSPMPQRPPAQPLVGKLAVENMLCTPSPPATPLSDRVRSPRIRCLQQRIDSPTIHVDKQTHSQVEAGMLDEMSVTPSPPSTPASARVRSLRTPTVHNDRQRHSHDGEVKVDEMSITSSPPATPPSTRVRSPRIRHLQQQMNSPTVVIDRQKHLQVKKVPSDEMLNTPPPSPPSSRRPQVRVRNSSQQTNSPTVVIDRQTQVEEVHSDEMLITPVPPPSPPSSRRPQVRVRNSSQQTNSPTVVIDRQKQVEEVHSDEMLITPAPPPSAPSSRRPHVRVRNSSQQTNSPTDDSDMSFKTYFCLLNEHYT